MIEKLSNNIIRAYRKRNGTISFHLRSHMFVKTNASFDVTHYLGRINSYFIMPNGSKIEFLELSIDSGPFLNYDGEYLIHEIHFKALTNLKAVKKCLVDMYILYSFFDHPCLDMDEFKCKALVKWMY